MSHKNIISVDLGGTKILTALLNSQNKIVERVKTTTDIEKGAKAIIDDVAGSIKKLLEITGVKEEDVTAISMGVPGTVNPHTGVVGNAPNLKIKNFNVKKALQSYFKIPVVIENDVNLATLGIQKFEFKKAKNMLVVFVGTGIGGGLVFDGNIYRGSSYFAGEIGHMKVSSDGYLNLKAGKSTFENIASRTAIVKAIKKSLKENPDYNSTLRIKKKIKSKALAKAVKAKDKIAVYHIKQASKVIGTVLGSLTTLLNLDTIVLGGGVLEAMSDFMMPIIEKSFYKAVLEEPGKFAKLHVTKLGDDAPLYGGIALAEEFLEEK